MRIVDSPHPLTTAAQLVGDSLSEHHAPTLLLLSGGSAAGAYETLAKCLVDCSQLTVGLVDERYSQDPQHGEANGRLIEATGLRRRVVERGGRFEPILHGAARDEEVAAFERLLRSFSDNPDARIVAVLGMGADGHTAGILPDSDAAEFSERFCGSHLAVGYDSHDQYRQRITLTVTGLRVIDEIFVVLDDAAKLPIFQKIILEKPPLHTMPATILAELAEVTIISRKRS